MAEKRNPVSYHSYLQLEKILGAQKPEAAAQGAKAHDETLFIIVHQVFELWFKQILTELDSIREVLSQPPVDERNMGVAVSRMHRISLIQAILLPQFKVLETMTPLDFLDFRGYLERASGFQSYQFRILENKLGLPLDKRALYGNLPYHNDFPAEVLGSVKNSESEPSLFSLIENWLARTPFLELGSFNFQAEFSKSVDKMFAADKEKVMRMGLAEDARSAQLKTLEDSRVFFDSILHEDKHNQLVAQGLRRLSYRATLAALFISLYRDEPMLHLPFKLLEGLVDLDEQFALWRFQHALMVLRMLGKKVGTGKSSGYDYLMGTVEKNRVFVDLANLSTILVPRSVLPKLPDELTRKLTFSYSAEC